jgi:hypothetical protein
MMKAKAIDRNPTLISEMQLTMMAIANATIESTGRLMVRGL